MTTVEYINEITQVIDTPAEAVVKVVQEVVQVVVKDEQARIATQTGEQTQAVLVEGDTVIIHDNTGATGPPGPVGAGVKFTEMAKWSNF